MSFDLLEANLGDFLIFKNGKSSPERADDLAYPVFGSNGIIGRSEETNCTADTIVIGRVGSYCGSVHFSEEKCWVSDNAISCTTKQLGEELFWFYFLKRLNLNQFSSGSGQPLLNQATLNSVECIVPAESDIRIDIGNILRSFDRKISLNTQINQTLEAMAQAIFKSWFVDFDPVKAKMNGEQPQGMDDATASLFPDKLVESELGLIPEGWRVGTLSSIVDVIMGQSPKGSTYNEDGEGVPLVNGPVEFGVYHPVAQKWTIAPTKMSKDKDLIVCVRGSTTGRYVVSNGVYCLGRGVCSIRSKDFPSFANYLFKSELNSLLTLTTGSTFPSWSGPTLKNFNIVIPPSSIIEKFEPLVSKLCEMMASNVRESESLSLIRDLLLPKLLSGEIELEQADVLAEAS